MTERPPTEHHLSIVTELADARARKATAPAVHEDLRAWAKGIHTSGAAVELLIRGSAAGSQLRATHGYNRENTSGIGPTWKPSPATSARCPAANGPTCS